MIGPIQLLRLVKINLTLMRYRVDSIVLRQQPWYLRAITYLNPYTYFAHNKPRGVMVRTALENLGPIFVKFGQLLSTRRDLLPEDIADELAKLQDNVPPFCGRLARQRIEKSLGRPVTELFAEFDEVPLASASIAQVHAAKLHDGSEVIVKVLRPKILATIRSDLAIMKFAAKLTEKLWSQGKRLRATSVVKEFEQTITDELDLQREAANASQLRRNFIDSEIMYVPKVYWDYTTRNIMVMERIHGVGISDLKTLHAKNTNMKKLAERGVQIFFTQVFRDSFFHADMHPGNLFVDVSDPENPRYLGVDFGIMGTLNPSDQHYLAQNFLAFFNRDYRRVAELHIESGWIPPDTRADQFESAIRTVCEPIFERPISEISFAQVLVRLFQTAERFNMEVQPQLFLLQKTLLSVEGLGRQLYPQLDLWATAKPHLAKQIRKDQQLLRFAKNLIKRWPETAEMITKSPKLVLQLLENAQQQQTVQKHQATSQSATRAAWQPKRFFYGTAFVAAALAVVGYCATPPGFTPHVLWGLGATAIVAALIGFGAPDRS